MSADSETRSPKSGGTIGRNHFYQDWGDSQVDYLALQIQSSTDWSAWTTSCRKVDLNHDGLPDFYSVNHLAGNDVLERICADEAGVSSPLPDELRGSPMK